MTNFDYDAHIKNEQIKANLTPEQLQELKDLYVERLVDNMSTKDLVAYVTDDMTDYVNKQSPVVCVIKKLNWRLLIDIICHIIKDIAN